MSPDAELAMREIAPEIIRAQRDKIERLRKALIDVERATWMEGPHEIGHYARIIVRCRTIAANASIALEQQARETE